MAGKKPEVHVSGGNNGQSPVVVVYCGYWIELGKEFVVARVFWSTSGEYSSGGGVLCVRNQRHEMKGEISIRGREKNYSRRRPGHAFITYQGSPRREHFEGSVQEVDPVSSRSIAIRCRTWMFRDRGVRRRLNLPELGLEFEWRS